MMLFYGCTTQTFAWLLSTLLNLAFPGQGMEQRQVVAGMCQPQDQPARAMGHFCGVQLFRRDPLRARHPSDNHPGVKLWGHQWKQLEDDWSCGKRACPRLGATTSSWLSELYPSLPGCYRIQQEKVITQNEWRMAVLASLSPKRLNRPLISLQVLTGLKTFRRQSGFFSFQTHLKIARLKALGSVLT